MQRPQSTSVLDVSKEHLLTSYSTYCLYKYIFNFAKIFKYKKIAFPTRFINYLRAETMS